MFLGIYRHAVDSKGRVALPAVFRRDLAQQSIITVGSEGRLVIRPQQEWVELQQHFQMTADTPPEERRYMRFLYANARDVELDSQGRMLISPELRRFASISDKAVFVGLGNIVEVIGEELWEAEMKGLGPEEFTTLNDAVRTHAQPSSQGGRSIST